MKARRFACQASRSCRILNSHVSIALEASRKGPKDGKKHTTKRICGDQLATRTHACILVFARQRIICDKLICNDFDADKLGDWEEISAGHSQQEGDRVADVAKDELQSEVWSAVLGDVDISVMV